MPISKSSSHPAHSLDSPPNIDRLGDLTSSGWKSRSVKEEMRANLIGMIRNGTPMLQGILGYDGTVIPQLQNAILARHDIILLGLRGQAKTRILRSLPQFLDPWIPYVRGSEIHDDPFSPLTRYSREMIRELGDDTPIDWWGRDDRYGEKLATPDTTVSDLIGDLDPIKAATLRMTLADEEVIHFGLIPRTHRGIFVINELPDLQPRIQVALLNILQERDIQIRGFNVRIPLDVAIAFSANPEDYTNRGNIITPLKDRIDSQIITHYPSDVSIARDITRQEAWTDRGGNSRVRIPDPFRDIVEWIAFEARASDYVDQKSGVSTRMTLTAMEQLVSTVERRCIRQGADSGVSRVADFYEVVPALTGKIELVFEGEQEGAVKVALHLIGKAINRVFGQYFPDPRKRSSAGPSGSPGRLGNKSSKAGRGKADGTSGGSSSTDYKPILDWFTGGNRIDLHDGLTDEGYLAELDRVDGLREFTHARLKTLLAKGDLSDHQPGDLAAWMGLVLEGLHHHSMLGRELMDGAVTYVDMVGSVLGGLGSLDDEEDSDMDDGQDSDDLR